ncbi:LysM peptidoglycan-binding domain-containing protein [Chengkuizengella sp. SCS-71B]|uniref:LysM peptidoglycan-binding domain-containing protein n=1 Tax=Chengkuizengella sp. SCS-71B TaxID=3115290 RepID=UPI0032C22CB5
MQIWLKSEEDKGKDELQLPVNPENIQVSSLHYYNDIHVTQRGEETILGGEKLREFKLSSFFPRDYNPVYCDVEESGFLSPWPTVQRIENWQHSGVPVRLIVTDEFRINALTTIRSFTYVERGGSPGDLYYTLGLKEFRYLTLERVETEEGVTLQEKRPSNQEIPSSYIVKPGDSLWKISHKVYRDGSKWKRIYNANEATIGSDPDKIFPGQKLVIPS